MFYRLFDKQTDCYIATGYNSSSKEELKNDYLSYRSGEIDDTEDTDTIFDIIWGDDFSIEESEIPFDETENPLNQ